MHKLYNHLISGGIPVLLLGVVGWFLKRYITTHDTEIKTLKEEIKDLQNQLKEHNEKLTEIKSINDKVDDILVGLKELNLSLKKVEDRYQEQSQKTLKNRYRIDSVMRDIERLNGGVRT